MQIFANFLQDFIFNKLIIMSLQIKLVLQNVQTFVNTVYFVQICREMSEHVECPKIGAPGWRCVNFRVFHFYCNNKR